MPEYEFTSDWFSCNIEKWSCFKTYLNSTFGPDLDCLELGSWEGRSAIYLMDNFIGNGSLTVVDNFFWGDSKTVFLKNVKLNPKFNQLNIMIGSTLTEVPKLLENKKQYDFIYIDAGKSSADNLFNLIICERLLKLNGLMVVDDYRWKEKDPSFINIKPHHAPKLGIDCFKQVSLTCEVYDEYYQVAFKKVKSNNHILLLN